MSDTEQQLREQIETLLRERDAAIARAEKAELQVTEYELARDAVLCDLGRDLNAACDRAEKAEQARDALRALLREARRLMADARTAYIHRCSPLLDLDEAIARIDAALKGGEP